MDNIQYERRESKGRAFERSFSYSAAIGNGSGRSSIEIPTMINTEVYTNEDFKKHYRISQTYVEGKEIAFPYIVTNIDRENSDPTKHDGDYSSQYSSEDENLDGGLVMTIDVETESPKSSEKRNISDASTQPVVGSVNSTDIYDTIEMAGSIDNDTDTMPTTVYDYSSPYTRRSKKVKRSRRQPGRPIRSRRVVYKSGEENVPVRSNIPAKSMKYMRDIVNTVINSKWRFIILLMVCSYFLFWFLFAGIWYAVTTAYRDDIGDGKDHCVTGTSSFAGLLMMAVETQMTIGYGVRYPNEECPEAIIIMVFEIIAGTALSGGLAGLLFTKMVRPNRQGSPIGFSKKATVCLRDGELCLQFRVWDLSNVHLIGSTINAYMLKPIRTLEGEKVQNFIHQLELKEARAFLLWPITVVHVINHESPLYDMTAQDMMDFRFKNCLNLEFVKHNAAFSTLLSLKVMAQVFFTLVIVTRFEIVVCLTGSSKSMGTMTQSRTSYLSKEIIWGYRFKNVLKWSKKHESYIIDVQNLDSVEQVETPLCSASQLKEIQEDIKCSTELLSSPTNFSFTRISLTKEESSTLSPTCESVPSSPIINLKATRRSFGWRFRRFFPERYYVEDQNGGLARASEL